MTSTTQTSAAPKTGIDIKKSLVDTVLAGLIALIVFGPIIGVVLDGYSFKLEPVRLAWMIGAVMLGRLLLSLFLQTPAGSRVMDRFETSDSGISVLPPGYKTRLRWIVPLVILAAVIFPFFASKYLLTVIILGLIYVLLGLGLNIVVGLAGLLDLGYVAFYAIGAYGLALGYQYLGLGFWTVLPLAAIVAALAGALLGFPVLRMHGDYLAIVTLGFGEDHPPDPQQLAVLHPAAPTACRCPRRPSSASSSAGGRRRAARRSTSSSASPTTRTSSSCSSTWCSSWWCCWCSTSSTG
jgi:amino acid/amide ABC transporter membrane protein 2, HAAT family (TC 3.A.1.4.-)